ncbi:TPA: CooT family nickel-binding protein [Thermoplasmata archaeon]|nr:CooT family nickel-binding protein [Thermoplasmata archaeon]
MCESAVYLIRGEVKTLVMQEAAKVVITDEGAVVVDAVGERKVVKDVDLLEANLINHEILLKPR